MATYMGSGDALDKTVIFLAKRDGIDKVCDVNENLICNRKFGRMT